jgi:prolyl-tRNA editing enzyme YbaK/EbsC (Cys-tRNA(Pro) deacylase)
MGMKQTLDVLNRMEGEGVIDRYAIGGAVGAYKDFGGSPACGIGDRVTCRLDKRVERRQQVLGDAGIEHRVRKALRL